MTTLSAWLWLGVYQDREWSSLHLFLKHRPSVQLFFHSPRGEADACTSPCAEGFLSSEQTKEEETYIDFIERHGGSKRSIYLPAPWQK